jgi:hypothetical protein
LQWLISYALRNSRLIIGLVVLSTLLAACSPPGAVRDFTAVAKDAASAFPPLVRDLPESCVRRQVAERPVDEIADVDDRARAACRNLFDLEPRLTGTVNVLVNYLNALNQLASGDIVSYDKQIDSFSSNLQSAGAFQQTQVKAVAGLAKFLANAAASGYQRRKIVETLKSADADLSSLCDGLGKIVGEDYIRVLQNEENALRSRYRDALQADTTKSSSTALILQEYWRRDLSTLNQKKAAARDLVQILEKIRGGHRKLAEQANHWTARDVIQTIGPYTVSIGNLVADYRKAF